MACLSVFVAQSTCHGWVSGSDGRLRRLQRHFEAVVKNACWEAEAGLGDLHCLKLHEIAWSRKARIHICPERSRRSREETQKGRGVV